MQVGEIKMVVSGECRGGDKAEREEKRRRREKIEGDSERIVMVDCSKSCEEG